MQPPDFPTPNRPRRLQPDDYVRLGGNIIGLSSSPGASQAPLPSPLEIPAKHRLASFAHPYIRAYPLAAVIVVVLLLSMGGVLVKYHDTASTRSRAKQTSLAAATNKTKNTAAGNSKSDTPAESTQKPATTQNSQPPTLQQSLGQATLPSSTAVKTPQVPAGDSSSAPYVGSLPDSVAVNSTLGFNYYYAGGRQFATASGASVTLTQAKPTVPEQPSVDNHSLMEMSVSSSDGKQVVEVGWVVDGTSNGDTLPHLFVYHWVNGQTSCYNGCGFVSTSKTVKAGSVVSTTNPGQYSINYSGGAWDISYNGVDFGNFPGSLWGGSFTQFGFVQVFGEVSVSTNSSTRCIQMGDGIAGSSPGSARISGFSLLGSSTAVALSPFATVPSSYSYGSASATGVNIGGPGTC